MLSPSWVRAPCAATLVALHRVVSARSQIRRLLRHRGRFGEVETNGLAMSTLFGVNFGLSMTL